MSTDLGLEKIGKKNGDTLDGNDIAKIDNNTDKIQNAFNNLPTGGSTVLQESHTYAELATMVSNNKLTAGKQYLLTDYKTKYRQPTTNVIKEVSTTERLVLTANSINSFQLICSSLDFPQDIIYYDFTNNKCEDGTTPRNGIIIRRIDTQMQINCTGDW
jgi:hypothetical protein